jgi:hypothetical protein
MNLRYSLKLIIDWLLHENQNNLFQALFSHLMAFLFLGLSALLLWPLGQAILAWRLFLGLYIFWIVLDATWLALLIFRRIAKIELDTNFDAYVMSALIVSCFLQAGWSAFAALTVQSVASGKSIWIAAALYLAGFVSSYIAYGIVASLYQGQIYRTVNLPLALLSFILFSFLPGIGNFIYGWFFRLVSRLVSLG